MSEVIQTLKLREYSQDEINAASEEFDILLEILPLVLQDIIKFSTPKNSINTKKILHKRIIEQIAVMKLREDMNSPILCFYGATRHLITGCRGTATITMAAGQFAQINFEFTGIYNAPDSTAMSGTFTVANQSAALEVNDTNITTATFHGATSQRLESFDLALNNEILYKETTSSKEVLIVNRTPGGTVVLEEPVRATTDYFAKAAASVTGNTSIVLGATSGNIVTVNVPQTDITGVTRADTGGVNALNLPYLALPTTAGNNELSIVMT